MEHPKKPLPALQRSEKYIGLAYLIFQMMLLPLLRLFSDLPAVC